MIKVDANLILEHLFRGAILGSIAFGINFTTELSNDNRQFHNRMLELTHEIKLMGERLVNMNRNHDSLEKRILTLENRSKK